MKHLSINPEEETLVSFGVSALFRVSTAPGKPGKMMKAFPVMKISWDFEILQNIMEK